MMKTTRRNQIIRILLIIVAVLAIACSAFAAEPADSSPPNPDTTGATATSTTESMTILAEASTAPQDAVTPVAPQVPETAVDADDLEAPAQIATHAEAPQALNETLAASPVQRNSDDLIIQLGDHGSVTSSLLEASVTGNAVNLAGTGPSTLDATIQVSGTGHFTQLYGVNTVALNSGAAGVQNISVSIGGNIAIEPPPPSVTH